MPLSGFIVPLPGFIVPLPGFIVPLPDFVPAFLAPETASSPKDFPLTLPGRLLPNFIVPLSWHAQIVTRNSVNLLTSNCAAGLPFFSSKLLLYLLEQDVLDENGYDFLLKMFNKRDQDCISSRQQKYIDGLIGFKVKPYLAQKLTSKIRQ